VGILEALFVFGDLCGCLLETGTLLSFVADAIAWFAGRENRTARRAAKRSGKEPPRRDRWSLAVWVLTPLVILLTAVVVVKWTRRR